MFEPVSGPRLFAVPPGADFPAALVEKLHALGAARPPEALARVDLIVNTARMARRIRDLFDAGPPCLLPRISLLTELDRMVDPDEVPPQVPALRRRLELAVLVAGLIDRQPDLAARDSMFDLADSLAALMDEMQGEGVSTDTIRALDVTDMSGHWARAQQFIGIADQYLAGTGSAQDAQARQRGIVNRLIARWQEAPPDHPVILAGSTGSRGTTLRLMQAVSALPQGAVVLPGFDFDQPESVWDRMDDALVSEDHPQFRFRRLMQVLGVAAKDIRRWSDHAPPSPARNRLISLALRPAPVTDAWMQEGPDLADLAGATSAMTLVEAPDPRAEALAIAMRLRKAAEDRQTAALITPDRMLTRRVGAALDRWGIVPDDSAGIPLHLSPPGRFLRHAVALFTDRLTAGSLMTVLKHPLCHAAEGRGPHLLHTRDLELHIRDKGLPFPDRDSLTAYGERQKNPDLGPWIAWMADAICARTIDAVLPLADWVDRLQILAEQLAAGSKASDSGPLWTGHDGRAALKVLTDLRAESDRGGDMPARDFAALIATLLAAGEVRDPDAPVGRIMVWGTLEARVQGADLLILAGLNEGSWPESPSPDPWLNRTMRDKAGLLLPERRIGLSAHDFQQAVCAPDVWLTRSVRSDDAETVAARWLNRLTNLLGGLTGTDGPKALADMRARGDQWLGWTRQIESVPTTSPAARPSPRPPVAARPRALNVTDIKRLIRDPYAIYARHVLRLKPLDPLQSEPDALLRGIVVHKALEDFIRESVGSPETLTAEKFLSLCRDHLARAVPWPTARTLWLARMQRIADAFITAETRRRSDALPVAFEATAECRLDPLDFALKGRADRIDRGDDGALRIYDYKTGTPPTKPQQAHFDKQLLIEIAMAERGAFAQLGISTVAEAVFIGVGSKYQEVAAPTEKEHPGDVWAGLVRLVARFMEEDQGFTSRARLEKDTDRGDYDQLARFGEWDHASHPTPEDLT